MTAYVALLRAVNLGGSTTLPKEELRRIGTDCGFASVTTFIASGNLLFVSSDDEATIVAKVASRVDRFFGKPVPVFVRTAGEMAGVVSANPFADRPGNRVTAHFMTSRPGPDDLAAAGIGDERLAAGTREIYIAYGDDMGHSKLKLPSAAVGTARNMNSVAKMAALLAAME